ncbi:FRG domain-containing protein [Leifsonia shinshuensis]
MSNRQEDDDAESDSREQDRDADEGTAHSGEASDEVTNVRGILEAIAASARSQFDPRALASMLAASQHATNLVSAQVAEIVSRLDLASTQTALAQYARFTEQWASLTRASDYAKPDPPQSTYSPQMTSAGSYFEADELEIDSVDDLHTAITTLIAKTPDLPLVWRGVRDANWGMHSHLFRHLMRVNGVVKPDQEPKGSQPYPDEDQMVTAERAILRLARNTWRFDDLSALETFARIQHAGGPTRLLDVTKNPYIGAWFAVEADPETEGKPARLFALATRPVVKDGKPAPPDSSLQLDEVGGLRDPFWHALETPSDRQLLDWGTGARRRVWVPPAYDPRISAQNAAFILDGVPITSETTAPYFTIEHNVYWRRADLLAASSIYAKMHPPTRKPRYNARNFAPTFSFRITAAAKPKIRDFMETRFGYGLSYIYPDIAALAAHLKNLDLSH